MNDELLKKLYQEGLISPVSFEKIEQKNALRLFSLHWELKTILYLGVLLLSTGLGILIYKNIDTIGHQVILLLIALISVGCFTYCFKQKKPYHRQKVDAPNAFFDYILLLGTLSFLTFIGYLQFQYNVFGSNYRLATFIPMAVLFYIAYLFDHLGVLSLAITNMALWMGVSVTPKQLLMNNDYNSEILIYTYLLLGLILLAAAFLAVRFNFKKHFGFTYMHFGVHVAFISLLMGYFFHIGHPGSTYLLLGVFVLGAYVYWDALTQHSFYFLLLAILYSYIAFSTMVMQFLFQINDGEGTIYLAFFYFIASPVAIILLLIRLNKKLKAA